jgi:hypothetical protein
LKRSIPWRFLRSLDSYPIFDNPREVPEGVWENRHLVVERFLPEMEGSHYLLRNWIFFRDQGRNSVSRSQVPVVKAATSFGAEEAPVPPELEAMRREIQADFGKFDYVLCKGKVVLYDVNRTPTYRAPGPSADSLRAIRRMADGLLSLRDAA